MAIKVTITSTKGGVGKTTLCANLAGILADLGQRVLAVDADIQPTLSSYYAITDRAPAGLMQLVSTASLEGIISRCSVAGLDLVLSDDPGGHLQNWVLHQPDGRVRMRHLLMQLESGYDVILIDTQGAVGPLQDAAILAADLLISPIPPEILSAREFTRGTVAMLERLRPMACMGAPVGPLRGVLYRMDHTRDARIIAQELREASYVPSRGAITILETVIPATVAYREAATHRCPVHRWETRRTGPTAPALQTMAALVHEVFPHLRGQAPRWSLSTDKAGVQ
ncbi:chromosome partitioning protein [Ectothiorhodospira haloalkaliphila]|uniref:Chromosome partitioning protein n=1 Tax=Ectothiorhodospira haloalkaliphila TaxID=421628 RepID=W8KIU5_9GAMM|nr:ParA family protein [Ectothiorhodospira haloalkaliphila]AHK79088.1 chromosome partitioning protein [Ectothiorhodospira haloalkaliphila]